MIHRRMGGRLKKLRAFERIEDDIRWELGVNVVLKYLGDDMVLLLGMAGNKAEEIIAEEYQHGTSPFHSLERWNPTMRPGHRLVCAQCWGIPIEVWDMGNIRKIMVGIGDLVEVDDDVEDMRRLDRARILIRTPWKPFFHHTVAVTIGGELHQVNIVEEGASDDGRRNFLGRRPSDSSEELDSDGIDGESLIALHSPLYELRRQPNNPDADPVFAVDNNGDPLTGTGTLIGRSADPSDVNHFDDLDGGPPIAVQVQLISRWGKPFTPDGDTVAVAANNPGPPLSYGPPF